MNAEGDGDLEGDAVEDQVVGQVDPEAVSRFASSVARMLLTDTALGRVDPGSVEQRIEALLELECPEGDLAEFLLLAFVEATWNLTTLLALTRRNGERLGGFEALDFLDTINGLRSDGE